MTLPASGAISFSQINTELCRSSTATLSLNDSGVRGLFGQASGSVDMNTGHGKSNTSVPGAPTGVSGSATSCSAISVSFSAPASNGGLSIDYYQAISSPGCFTATGTSPISVSGLSAATSYTFRVRAHNSKGYGCYSSSSGSVTTSAAPGSQSYTSAGTYSWVAPAGVTSVSAVTIGKGGKGTAYCNCGYYVFGGSGGGLGYRNNISVTPSASYTVYVPCYCYGGASTYFINLCTVSGSNNGSHGGTGGGNGGGGGYWTYDCCPKAAGGGGAGGYSGAGGCGGGALGLSGGNGAGGGAAGGNGASSGGASAGKPGGGVGLFGQGSSGTSGTNAGGGSGGTSACGFTAGSYGGGARASNNGAPGPGSPNTYNGAGGAVRIVWPGNTRTFPSTGVGSP